MKQSFLLLCLFCSFCLHGQKVLTTKTQYYRFGISNSHTAKPFASLLSLVYKEFHPGFEISRGKILKEGNKHQWFGELTLSYLHHRWVQHNLALYLNGGYRRSIGESWGAVTKLGAGYQASMPTEKVYAITDNGIKEKGHILRSQFIAAFSIGGDKIINKRGLKLFIDYQQKIQAPFIKEYVPLLPYNTLLIGASFPIQQPYLNSYEK